MDIFKIGKYIKILRMRKGLTQGELAAYLNVTDKAVSKWESGKGLPEIETLLNLADIFNVTVDDLLRAKQASNIHTEFLYILDASGSMYGLTDDVIGGFNSFLMEQHNLDDSAYLSTVLFNNIVSPIYHSKDITTIEPMSRNDYKASGSTSLFDAIGSSVLSLSERAKTNKVMVIIMTDGYENSSRLFSRSKVKRIIDMKTADGWEFIFAGANIDVDKVSESIGIRKDRRVHYESNSKGTRETWKMMSNMSSIYRTTGNVKIEDE
ncbi:MAG: helix-turn-helix domain-containing protein [Candidatus Izimaplasma sp.]|nr:helix-turn-helix domain-containing protein [Candidatus Izimaplasma bacterium]